MSRSIALSLAVAAIFAAGWLATWWLNGGAR